MKLKKLTLTNFQGMRSFALDTDGGQDVAIYGDNAQGKTTIYNAFLWLLFEKNSMGAKDFEIKTRDDNGEVIPGIDHSVEAVFEINGKDVTLKRSYLEKYTKKRGSAASEFTGHVTEHFVDGVPRSKGEYQAFIDNIAPEKLFMTITSPTYFNELLTWQERRQILIGLCPNVNDSDMIVAKSELSPLKPILSGMSIDDAKKVEMATRKKINEELTGIPGRIDEANRAIPENATGNPSELVARAQRVAAELEQLRSEKVRILAGGQIAAKQKELAEIDLAIVQLKNKHATKAPDLSDEREQLRGLGDQVQQLEIRIDAEKREILRLDSEVGRCKILSKGLSSQWSEINASRFIPGGACPTCGQNYPENLIAVQEGDFNRAKAERLEKVIADGKANENTWKAAAASTAEKQESIANSQLAIDDMKKQVALLQGKIDKMCMVPSIETLPEYLELTAKRDAVYGEITSLNGDSEKEHSEISQRIEAKQQELDAINRQISAIEAATIQRGRIDELKAREKELAKQFEQSERILFLIEQFVKAKVSLLESSINSRFETVKFKLFDQAINGGISETCVCTVGGVPYPSINNGARIQAGCEIVAVLQDHYSLLAPVFIDNRESVTSLPPMPCQMISLVVSEADKKLRIETSN